MLTIIIFTRQANHVCDVQDAPTTHTMIQTYSPAIDGTNMIPFAGDRILTVSRREGIQTEFDYQAHYNTYNLNQPSGMRLGELQCVCVVLVARDGTDRVEGCESFST